MIDEQAEDASGLAEHCYYEGCQEWITGSSDYCPEHAKVYAPEQAGQSTPAPRQWREGDEEPGLDVVAVRHSNSQLWTRVITTTEQPGVRLRTRSPWKAGAGARLEWDELTARLHGYALTEVPREALSVSPSGENTTPVGAEGQDNDSTAQGASQPDIPEMRVGMVDGTWTVALADGEGGWVVAGTWEPLAAGDVADWTEVHEAVNMTEFQEELYNRAVAAENELARRLPLPDSETEWRRWQCPEIQPENARLGKAQRCSLRSGHESPHAWVGKFGSLSTWDRR